MCSKKRQRRCPALLAIREEAFAEWTRAETFEDVCRAWGRLGGRVTLHRYGREHFSELAKASSARGPAPDHHDPTKGATRANVASDWTIHE